MIVTHTISLTTKGKGDIIDVTDRVGRAVRDTKLVSGIVTVFVKHTTAGVCVIEVEDGLLEDYQAFWERIAPPTFPYAHNFLEEEDKNGHAHVRATTLGPSLVVPFANGQMTLGTWQKICLMDFDTRGRSREVVLQVMGE